jgi:LytS/YehU family sensor histidine kinase
LLTQWLPTAGPWCSFTPIAVPPAKTAELLHTAELDRIRRSRIALESRLQAMQARVEPQFLFNTLAQVGRLYEVAPATAAHMLDELIAYLRAAMPLMRDTSSTVAREVDLARAYLDIVAVRLGDRLRVSIDLPAAARDVRMPPMMLLPLVDHAIVYGIERSVTATGTIRIETRVGNGRLRLAITDSGAGFVPDGDGDGIASVRERLAALYGEDGVPRHAPCRRIRDTAVLDIPLHVRRERR